MSDRRSPSYMERSVVTNVSGQRVTAVLSLCPERIFRHLQHICGVFQREYPRCDQLKEGLPAALRKPLG